MYILTTQLLNLQKAGLLSDMKCLVTNPNTNPNPNPNPNPKPNLILTLTLTVIINLQ